MSVVLINPFEVPAHVPEDQFLAGWERAADLLKSRPGFIGSRLHRSLSPDARFRFVNVAEWKTAADFQAALNHPVFVALREATPFAHYPSVYEVARA